MLNFFSSIGASKSTIAGLKDYGYIKVDDGEEKLTYGKAQKKRPVSLFSASAKAINKIGGKGAKLREHTAKTISASDITMVEGKMAADMVELDNVALEQLKAQEKAREKTLEAQTQAEAEKWNRIRNTKKAMADHVVAPVTEAEKKKRGRPRKEPLKRGRGRPKGSIKVAK